VTTPPDRRRFLKTAAAGGPLLALANLEALLPAGSAGAADVPARPDRVRFSADVEPLVRLIEETERDRCLEVVVARLRRGASYRQFLAALFLAGIREVNPRPCGFKLHCVFVIQAAHAMSLDAPLGERLLPLCYALDYFKQCQADDAIRGDFVMRPVAGRLPAPERAAEELAAGMEAWDIDRTERAVVALARRQGPRAAFEDLWHYGARDWRGIGHRAIYTANAWRTLQTVGWQHAEPVLRSLVVSLLCVGRRRRVDGYAFEDQCYLANTARVKEAAAALPADWRAPRGEAGVTRNVLDALRTGTAAQACGEALRHLVHWGAPAGAVWDAVHLAAVELVVRGSGQVGCGVHAVTSANALHQAFLRARDPQTQLLLLLQAVGWMGQFKNMIADNARGLRDRKITDLVPADLPADADKAVAETMADVTTRPDAAAGKVIRLAGGLATADAFMTAARRLVFAKADEPHYYKFPAALFEDCRLVSAAWRPHVLAATVYYLKAPDDPDSPVMRRAREAVRPLGG
jgi:hypothetical protein